MCCVFSQYVIAEEVGAFTNRSSQIPPTGTPRTPDSQSPQALFRSAIHFDGDTNKYRQHNHGLDVVMISVDFRFKPVTRAAGFVRETVAACGCEVRNEGFIRICNYS